MKQEKINTIKVYSQVRVTVKVAVLEDEPSCPNTIVSSVYDTKSVHFRSTSPERINWIDKTKYVFSISKHHLAPLNFLDFNQCCG